MAIRQSSIADASSDRRVLGAAIICVVATIVLLGSLVSGRFTDSTAAYEVAFWTETLAGIVLLVTLLWAAPLALREMGQRRVLALRAQDARSQVEQLFKMTDMLQSAIDYGDANAVLKSTAAQLLPGFGGMLHVFNNSRDRLDLSVAWDWPSDSHPPQAISPTHCWALKRGKPHLNQADDRALRCEHHAAGLFALEIPMMARGEVYGLLTVQAAGEDAQERLEGVSVLAGAVADAMSLALSNIALREKLRTQALRDPLTGLYNRRYMEDVLARYINLADRNGSAVSAIMIDLDHFKRLNDEHGHAMGDAVLREAAAAIAGTIRPSDVACRYGGEELVVLLPDCPLDQALVKAEVIRARIESLSEIHGARISASCGVATMPDTSDRTSDIIAAADAALYRAKQAGRNQIAAAPRRPSQLAVAAE